MTDSARAAPKVHRFVLRPATTERRVACVYAPKETPSALLPVDLPLTCSNGAALRATRYAQLDAKLQYQATVTNPTGAEGVSEEVLFRPVLLDSSDRNVYFMISSSRVGNRDGTCPPATDLDVAVLEPLVRLQRERTLSTDMDGGATSSFHSDMKFSSLWGSEIVSNGPSTLHSFTDEDELTGGYGFDASDVHFEQRNKYQKRLGLSQSTAPLKRPREEDEEQQQQQEEGTDANNTNNNNNNRKNAQRMPAPPPLPPKPQPHTSTSASTPISPPPEFVQQYLISQRGQTVLLADALKALLRVHPEFATLKQSSKEEQRQWAQVNNARLLKWLGQKGVDVSDVKKEVTFP